MAHISQKIDQFVFGFSALSYEITINILSNSNVSFKRPNACTQGLAISAREKQFYWLFTD